MEKYNKCLFLPNLLRKVNLPASGFFYDVLRATLSRGLGVEFWDAPYFDGNPIIVADELKRFLPPDFDLNWQKYHWSVPEVLEERIVSLIPKGTLVLSYEMPPWLKLALENAQIDWLDVRLSSLRYGHDLFVGLASSNSEMDRRIRKQMCDASVFRFEADLLKARLRHMQRFKLGGVPLRGAAVFVGQTEADASLLREGHSNYLRLSDYEGELKEIARTRDVIYYKAHPMASRFHVKNEMQILKKHFKSCRRIYENAYSLLSLEDEFLLVGISSGCLSEAEYFGKNALFLHEPLYRFYEESGSLPVPGYYSNWSARDFLSPGVWYDCFSELFENAPSAVLKGYRYADYASELRRLHNAYWGYAEVDILDSEYYQTLGRFYGRGFKKPELSARGLMYLFAAVLRRWMKR
ncbi:hypothetical protein [Coraliomargarita parva]|uniref:hypothetical protein n=1 Tax=Coraliomargarita parva TaxID=3014050 RepID=UPI0022B35680|nr:hypothetical protein [Coraliomargarita parva]